MIHSFSMASFLACTCPNRSRVGEINSPDLFEQVFEQYEIPKVPEKNFKTNFLMVRRQKMFIFGV